MRSMKVWIDETETKKIIKMKIKCKLVIEEDERERERHGPVLPIEIYPIQYK